MLTTLSFADKDLVSNLVAKTVLQHTVIREFVYMHNNDCLGDALDPNQLRAGEQVYSTLEDLSGCIQDSVENLILGSQPLLKN